MNGILAVLGLVLSVLIVLLVPDNGATAILITLCLAAGGAFLIFRIGFDRTFLLQLFVGALLLRMLIGTLIFVFQWQGFFGGDAYTYDFFGYAMLQSWEGDKFYQIVVNQFTATAGSGWGMLYLVAAVYKIIGRNPLAIQFTNAVLGAFTAIITYLTVQEIFDNQPVSRVASMLVALFPSLVLWTSQGLKDGPIMFLLAMSMLATLKLGNRFSVKYLVILIFALFSLLTLRFYVFYMAAMAVGIAFLFGTKAMTAQSLARQVIVIALIMTAFFYLGVTRYAGTQFETYGTREMLQRTRADAATSAESGFGRDVDVSTTEGAIGAIPLGFTYLMLAPFPWQMTSLRSLITLPEMIVWWSSLPILCTGLWFSLKSRLRKILPILIFTIMLTFSYSVFQGNIGNAYRQRAQLLIFYFIFTSAGFVLMKEKRAESARIKQAKRQKERAPVRLVSPASTAVIDSQV